MPYSDPRGDGKDGSVYALDSIGIGSQWTVDLGVRWDRFKTNFSEAFTATALDRTDTFVSPRVAVIYQPTAAQSRLTTACRRKRTARWSSAQK